MTVKKDAVVSACGRYRYQLDRWWDDGRKVAFIMLNPSTADAEEDDATIRRCMGYGRLWGYGGIRVVNLFAYRATDPKCLKRVARPIGPENDYWIRNTVRARQVKLVIAAWGTGGAHLDRDRAVFEMVSFLTDVVYALDITKRGFPAHPLRLRKDVMLQRYRMQRDRPWFL